MPVAVAPAEPANCVRGGGWFRLQPVRPQIAAIETQRRRQPADGFVASFIAIKILSSRRRSVNEAEKQCVVENTQKPFDTRDA